MKNKYNNINKKIQNLIRKQQGNDIQHSTNNDNNNNNNNNNLCKDSRI
jgi:hypothetical protein